MTTLRTLKTVTAYQYTGDPQHPGWPEGWCGAKIVAMLGGVFAQSGNVSWQIYPTEWLIEGEDGEIDVVLTDAVMRGEYEVVEGKP